MLDQANSENDHEAPKPSRRPTFGSLRRNLSRTDTAGSTNPQPSPTDDTPWLKRFTTSFWKRKPSSPVASEASEKTVQLDSPKPERPKPQLTITPPNESIHTVDHTNNADAVPASAWSVSPRQSSWLSSVVPPKLPALRHKPRQRVSVPVDVSSTGPSPADIASMPMPVPVAMSDTTASPVFTIPLHHGFETPVSPPAAAMQSPPVDGGAQNPFYTNHHLSPPPTASHAGHAVDPFATPFDDEPYASPTFDRKNPFVAVAL